MVFLLVPDMHLSFNGQFVSTLSLLHTYHEFCKFLL